MMCVGHLTEENRTNAVAVSFLKPLVQSYISWWEIDSVLWFPEQANHHKNEENHSSVKGQLERHMEEEEFLFPSDMCFS